MPRFNWINTSKPPIGTTINPAHSLARGLGGFYAFNEGGGANCYDAMSRLSLSNSGGVRSSTRQSGLAFTTNNTGATSVTLPSWITSTGWPITLAVGFRQLGSPVSSASLWGASYTNNASSPYFGWELSYNGTVGLRLQWNSAGTAESLAGATLPATGTDAVASATITATAQNMYLNGAAYANSATASSNPTYGGTPQLCLATEPGVTTRNPNAIVYWAGWWTRALSANEHLIIGSDSEAIWQIYQPSPPSLSIWLPSSSPSSVTYTFAPPASTNTYVGNPTGNFSLTPSGPVTDTVTIADGSEGGTFSPSNTFMWSASEATQYFDYTPANTGSITITPTSNAGDSIGPASIAINSLAITYSFSGPPGGSVNVASAPFSILPVASTNDTFSLSDASNGTFTPSSLTVNSANAATFTYTAPSVGNFTLTPTSNAGDIITPPDLVFSATNGGGGTDFIYLTYLSSTTAAAYRRRRRMQG